MQILVEDNKMLTSATRTWLAEQVEWARDQAERNERRAAKKAAHLDRVLITVYNLLLK